MLLSVRRVLRGAIATAALCAAAGSGGVWADGGGGTGVIRGSYNVVRTGTPQPSSQVITWDGTDGISINSLVGADRFYGAGVFGQGTASANVEAGLVWNGHETTTGVTDFYVAPGASGETDMHATWVGSTIAGFDPNQDQTNGYPYYKLGIAPLTQLSSGAIATDWYNQTDPTTQQVNTYFNITPKTFYAAYNHYFTTSVTHTLNYGGFSIQFPGPTNVINSSWGFDDPTSTDPFTKAADGLARANPLTTFVVAAGNATTATNVSNNVGGPASGYNNIAVGAVGDFSVSNFTTVASFSSRGPQDYYDPVHGTVPGVRAAVSLVAPGTSLLAAYYGAQTGGNGAGLSTSVPDASGGANNWYSLGLAGTSFAAPLVSGGVSLLSSASYYSGFGDNSRDARVIKAVLMNSATKLPGWDNGQHVNGAGVTVTTQSVDWSQGAGMLNLDRAFDQYLSGTAGVAGGSGGAIATVGWDYGSITKAAGNAPTTHNDYAMTTALAAGTMMDVTLDWFRDRGVPVFTDNADPNLQTLATDDSGMANLYLEIWSADFTKLYAESMSVYNNVQELYFVLPDDGLYGIRVEYADQMFGTPVAEIYGLAWDVTGVPEPGALAILGLGGVVLVLRRRGVTGRGRA